MDKEIQKMLKQFMSLADMSTNQMNQIKNMNRQIDFGDVVIPYSNIDYPQRKGKKTLLHLKSGKEILIDLEFEKVKEILGV